jgi:hypothetical protein
LSLPSSRCTSTLAQSPHLCTTPSLRVCSPRYCFHLRARVLSSLLPQCKDCTCGTRVIVSQSSKLYSPVLGLSAVIPVFYPLVSFTLTVRPVFILVCVVICQGARSVVSLAIDVRVTKTPLRAALTLPRTSLSCPAATAGLVQDDSCVATL